MAEKDVPNDERDLVSKLKPEERAVAEFRLQTISPDDGKYGKSVDKLREYLSPDSEWRTCAYIQKVLLETRLEFSNVPNESFRIAELKEALKHFNPINAALLEDKVTHHDQLAVLEELGRYITPETKALLHPGTTSYDILDTARAYLLQGAWRDEMRCEISNSIKRLCELSEEYIDVLQVGRTHLQDTSPVLFGGVLASYAARFAERVKKCDGYFYDLRGKISGIVGTGASIEMVIEEGKSIEFEERVLEKLGLKPDYTATQITQKERLADVGHGITTLMAVLGDFANDMRFLYSSAIGEVSDRESAQRLGGSSADAGKNNPINWENIAGKVAVVEGGMRVLYEMIHSDLQRDLRGSVQARYQPNQMIAETFESFSRANRALKTLSINRDRISQNLKYLIDNPTEAMTAILRGVGYIDPVHGVGHDFVKTMARKAKNQRQLLLDVCLCESETFGKLLKELADYKQAILRGNLQLYTGSARERAQMNIAYAKSII